MNYDEIVSILAPCGLDCTKCVGFSEGEIQHHSQRLAELLKNFDTYAERFSHFMPVYKNYSHFKELLHFFAQASCNGCRKGDCKYPQCGVAACYKENKVDFCFQCNEFPCEKTNFDPNLKKRWLSMNEQMKQKGVEAYYEETKDKPRYE